MRDKFIEISLNDLSAKDILYQHDKGQVIRFVEEIGDGTLVLFNNSNIKEDAVPRYIENCSVEIPDRLLEAEGSLVVTVKLVDSNSETTQKVIKIKIKSGSKQNEEIEPENQQTFIEQIQGIMNSTKSIAENVQERAEEKIKTNEAVLKQIDDKANEAVKTIEQTKNDAVGVLVDEKDAVLNEVGGAKTTALNDIANREKLALANLETAETTAKNNIQAKTTESLNTIGTKATKVIEEMTTLKENAQQSEHNAEQSAELAQQTAEGIVADREQINKNKDNIAGLKSDLDHNKEAISELNDKKITKFYANSLGETSLQDSDTGKIQDMMIYGRGEQFSTTGAQLFDEIFEVGGIDANTGNNLNYTITSTKSVRTKNYIPVVAGETYTLTNGIANTLSKTRFYDVDKKYIGSVLKSGSLLATNDTLVRTGIMADDVAYMRFELDFSDEQTGQDVLDGKYKYMLNVGSTALPYEPYTGGVPSPNPDYPQKIQGVVNPKITVSGAQLQSKGGYNYNNKGITVNYVNETEITIKGTATAKCSSGFYLVNIKKNTKYTLSLYGIDLSKIKVNVGILGDLSTTSTTFNSGSYTKRWISFTVEEGTTVDCTFKLMLNEGSTALPYEPYKEQVATLPYTLNAIPVSSGGNVTIDGQQYVADYVDVEKKQLIQNTLKWKLSEIRGFRNETVFHYNIGFLGIIGNPISISTHWKVQSGRYLHDHNSFYISIDGLNCSLALENMSSMTDNEIREWIRTNNPAFISKLSEPKIIDLTDEEVQLFKDLATYYPHTNVMVTSEQLDGYTTFNYPISLANGWNYVKEQLGDTREFIYDMELQSAEAYVNSEYAVALSELEV